MLDPVCPPPGSETDGPVSQVLLSEGDFQVVYPLACGPGRCAGAVKVLFRYG